MILIIRYNLFISEIQYYRSAEFILLLSSFSWKHLKHKRVFNGLEVQKVIKHKRKGLNII